MALLNIKLISRHKEMTNDCTAYQIAWILPSVLSVFIMGDETTLVYGKSELKISG